MLVDFPTSFSQSIGSCSMTNDMLYIGEEHPIYARKMISIANIATLETRLGLILARSDLEFAP